MSGRIEYGHPVPISGVDGRPSASAPNTPPGERKAAVDVGRDAVDQLLAEARARTGEGAGAVGSPGPSPREDDAVPQWAFPEDVDTTTWMAIPASTLTAQTRRAAEIALEAARLELPGLPERLELRYMCPYQEGTYKLYAEVLGAPPRTFTNVARPTGGTFFPSRPDEVWVSVKADPGGVAHYVVHELCHLWRHRTGRPAGMTDADEEREADALADKLLPLIVACAADEGGLLP